MPAAYWQVRWICLLLRLVGWWISDARLHSASSSSSTWRSFRNWARTTMALWVLLGKADLGKEDLYVLSWWGRHSSRAVPDNKLHVAIAARATLLLTCMTVTSVSSHLLPCGIPTLLWKDADLWVVHRRIPGLLPFVALQLLSWVCGYSLHRAWAQFAFHPVKYELSSLEDGEWRISWATGECEKGTGREDDCSLICLWQNNLCEPVPSNYISATELFHKDPIANAQLFQVSSSTCMTDPGFSVAQTVLLILLSPWVWAIHELI